MTRLLVATTNKNKLREIRDLLADVPVELTGLDAYPPVREPDESGETFEENARLKAEYYDRLLGSPEGLAHRDEGVAVQACDFTVAEDSGLVIDGLDGEPGVRSARYLRSDATYPERFEDIYRRLDERRGAPRTARFVCALAVVSKRRVIFETRGVVEGEITRPPRGTAGFGYDPIFFYPPYGCTLAEVTQASKLQVAHRGRAFRALAAWLRGGVGA
jgi:XTP/dITP diphosphohydrolase